MTETLFERGRNWAVDVEWDAADDAWIVFVPELNNTSTFGASREEALDRAHEAICGYLKAAARRGLPILEPVGPGIQAHSKRQLCARPALA